MILKTMKMLAGLVGIMFLLPLNAISLDVHHTMWRTEKVLYDEIYDADAKQPGRGVARLKPVLPSVQWSADRKNVFRKLSKRDQKKFDDLTGCSRKLKSMLQLFGEGCYTDEIGRLKAILFSQGA